MPQKPKGDQCSVCSVIQSTIKLFRAAVGTAKAGISFSLVLCHLFPVWASRLLVLTTAMPLLQLFQIFMASQVIMLYLGISPCGERTEALVYL